VIHPNTITFHRTMADWTTHFPLLPVNRIPDDAQPAMEHIVHLSYDGNGPPPPYSLPTTPPPTYTGRRETMRPIFEPASRPLRQQRARLLHSFDVIEDEALPSGNIRQDPAGDATANSRRPFCVLDGWSYLIAGVALVLICIAFVIGAYFARKR
jgi:hypothetical protein